MAAFSQNYAFFVVQECFFLTGNGSSYIDISELTKKGFQIQPYCSVLIVKK